MLPLSSEPSVSDAKHKFMKKYTIKLQQIVGMDYNLENMGSMLRALKIEPL